MADDARTARDERGRHGGCALPGLVIDSYNLPLKDPDGDAFLGDRASQTAFRALLQARRDDHQTGEDDPFGDTPSREVSKERLDLVLVGGDADAAHLMHGAIEDYARNLADVIPVFLAQPQWTGVRRIVLGGGFQESQTGGLAVRRTRRLLEQDGVDVELHLLGHDADDGGLLGWVHLAPDDAREHHDAFLAVDIGGTKIRCGIVKHGLQAAPDGARAEVLERTNWRHAEDDPDRSEAVTQMAGMLNGLIAQARTTGLRLAPFVGIACPGQIRADGSIAHGAQNLPGDWEADGFRLPEALARRLDPVDGQPATIVMHNDAVVQGLSELPRMRDASAWAVLTIGTGLGNASYRTLDPSASVASSGR
ncbi:MAG TPA: ROK family protein [Luteimonas sp.]|nr:ROK family protein [Luteimonas sp.]